MAIPFLISLLIVQLNVFTDTFWVSNLGEKSVSGMTSAVPIYTAIMSIGIGLSTGIVTTIAYRIGKGEKDAAGKLAGNTIVLAIIIPAICSIILFFATDLLIEIMGAQDVSQEIHDYLLPFLLLSPITVLNTAFGGMLRAEGAAGRSTTVQLSSVAINMILDPILIFIMNMGVMGAGLATVISYLFGVIISINWYIHRKTMITIRRADLHPEKLVMKELLGVGGPRIVEGFVNNTVILIQRIFIIMASGTVGVTLFNVPFRYITLSMCPVEAVGMASVPVIAANLGNKDYDKMKTARYSIFKAGIIISLVIAVAIFILSPILIDLFTVEPSMHEWYDELLWNMQAYCIILPLFAIQTLSASILQALKKTRLPMRISIIVGVFRIIVFWLACPYGFQGITVALILSYVLSCSLSIIAEEKYFKKGTEQEIDQTMSQMG